MESLIPEDIYYLNRIYELQTYRAQIKKFLDIHKPFFIYEGQQYFIEDIASYHIHAGDYFIKYKPAGAHSNYVSEVNSYKIYQGDFVKLAEKLMKMKSNPMPFAIIYRDDNNWVDCKGFDSKEEMELFVKKYSSEVRY